MAPRAISLWSHMRPLRNGIRKVAKYSGPTNSTCASCACEAGLPRISTGRRPAAVGRSGIGGDSGGKDARHCRDLVAQFGEEAGTIRPGGVRVFANGNHHRHHVLRFIAERNGVHANKALNSRAGRGHQQQSQSDLAGNERRVHAPAFHAAGEASRAGLHHLADLRLRRLQRGKEAEDDSAQDCQAHAEKQNRQVDVEVGFVGIGVIGQAAGR